MVAKSNIGASSVGIKGSLISALDGDPRTGMCHCPAHADSRPSLSVTEAANGKVLWHCFAGCSKPLSLTRYGQEAYGRQWCCCRTGIETAY